MKDTTFLIRMETKFKKRIQKHADRLNSNISSYIRMAVARAMEVDEVKDKGMEKI